jgi:hypothetical protein
MRRMARLSVLMSCVLIAAAEESLATSEETKTIGSHVVARHASSSLRLWQPRLLSGQDKFTFTMYGCPGQLESLKELVRIMREKGLGNGFDPGPFGTAASKPLFEYLATVGWPIISYPPAYGEFQVKEGRSRLSDQDEQALQILDRAGVFNALQLGEWGYFFHNLSSDEGWFHNVYGKDFEKYRHLIKPTGLAGYDRKPKTRRECYEAVRDYYLTRNRFLRGRNMSVTGHSHYEVYAAEWGAPLVGLELGENIAFAQSKIAFARGTARQWKIPWSVQVSPWFHGSCTTSGPLRMEGRYARGLDAGHSLSFYQRLWRHAWFAGAAMVTPENSIAIFFDSAEPPWKLSSHGRAAAETFTFMQNHNRGIPYTPVAIVLDHLAGYNAYKGKPWGILENSPGDLETTDLFQHQLFPGSDHIHANPFPGDPEQSYLRPTPFGEMFDVLLSSAGPDVLGSYPVILLVGDITFDADFTCRLFHVVRGGSRLLLHPRHVKALGDDYNRLKGTGTVEVLTEWTNPATDRSAAISNKRLAELNAEYLPIAVTGDPVQYQVNRTPQGWAVELVNNRGVVKKPDQPAVVDPNGLARIQLRPRVPIHSACQWTTDGDTELNPAPTFPVTIGPGETVFVEFATDFRTGL